MASIVSNEPKRRRTPKKSFGASVRPGKERTYKNTRQSFGEQNRLGFFLPFVSSETAGFFSPRTTAKRAIAIDRPIDTIDPPDRRAGQTLSIPYRGALLRGLFYHCMAHNTTRTPRFSSNLSRASVPTNCPSTQRALVSFPTTSITFLAYPYLPRFPSTLISPIFSSRYARRLNTRLKFTSIHSHIVPGYTRHS